MTEEEAVKRVEVQMDQYVMQFKIMAEFGTLVMYSGQDKEPHLMPFSPDGRMTLSEYLSNDPEFHKLGWAGSTIFAFVKPRNREDQNTYIYDYEVVPADAKGLLVTSSKSKEQKDGEIGRGNAAVRRSDGDHHILLGGGQEGL
jgi:hypothetical protein